MTTIFYNIIDGLKSVPFRTLVFKGSQKVWLVRGLVGRINYIPRSCNLWP